MNPFQWICGKVTGHFMRFDKTVKGATGPYGAYSCAVCRLPILKSLRLRKELA